MRLIQLIKQFDRIYTFCFNELFRLRLMNNELNSTTLKYHICRDVFSEEGSKIKEKLLSAKMTFKNFVLEKKNRPNIEPRYRVETMWPRLLENKTMSFSMNGNKDICTEFFFNKEFYFNNFRCLVDKDLARLWFYVYLGPIVEEDIDEAVKEVCFTISENTTFHKINR